jgi:hypothetical protein
LKSNITEEESIDSSEWHQQRGLFLRIIKASTVLSNLDVGVEDKAKDYGMSNDARYSICQHEDLGDLLLRSVVGFL